MTHQFLKKIPPLKKLFFLSLCLVTLTLNYPKHNYNTIALITLVIIWIITFKDQVVLRLKCILKSKITLVFIVLFIVYCLGLLFSSNIEEGLKVVKLKIPLLLIPVTFFISQLTLTEKQIEIIKKIFIVSTVLLCGYSIIAIYLDLGPVSDAYLASQIKSYFHSELTVKIRNHPTYLSYTIIICLLFLIDLIKQQKIKVITFVLLFTFFSIYTILLASKIGVILYSLLSLYFLQQRIKRKYRFLFVITGMILLTSLIATTSLGKRFYGELETIELSKNLKDKTVPTSKKNQRLIALDIFLHQPTMHYITGIGTGDVQKYLEKKYRYYLETIHRNAFKDLNFHNQFLQTTTEIGFIGLLLLLYSFVLSFKIALNRKSKNHIIFLISTFLFFCIESFFETQRGVMLFIFTNSLFIYFFKE